MASQNQFGKSGQQLSLRLFEATTFYGSKKENQRRISDRTLKIEEDGDFSKGNIKPKIRLMGQWLERAGFQAGHRVQVKFIAAGVIELRSSTKHPPPLSEL